jgi:hypothetical protein
MRRIFRPKFFNFLRDLIPENNPNIDSKIEKVRTELLADTSLDICGHQWMTLFVAQHILSFINARDTVNAQ